MTVGHGEHVKGGNFEDTPHHYIFGWGFLLSCRRRKLVTSMLKDNSPKMTLLLEQKTGGVL